MRVEVVIVKCSLMLRAFYWLSIQLLIIIQSIFPPSIIRKHK
ncbi:Uncharacterised protein [Vibrio cholerae]|nr:Uncharacterised protein [Vibrio cholerae]CSI35388.1 Uncharacterised protein [Vibrio cholerae]